MINCIPGMCFQSNPPVLTSPQDTLLGERSESGWEKKMHNWKPFQSFSKIFWNQTFESPESQMIYKVILVHYFLWKSCGVCFLYW